MRQREPLRVSGNAGRSITTYSIIQLRAGPRPPAVLLRLPFDSSIRPPLFDLSAVTRDSAGYYLNS